MLFLILCWDPETENFLDHGWQVEVRLHQGVEIAGIANIEDAYRHAFSSLPLFSCEAMLECSGVPLIALDGGEHDLLHLCIFITNRWTSYSLIRLERSGNRPIQVRNSEDDELTVVVRQYSQQVATDYSVQR